MSERHRWGDRQHLSGIEGEALLADGHTVLIRLAQAGDSERVTAFYRGLSDESIYSRFLAVRHPVPDSEIYRVVAPGAHHVALVACVADEVIGIGELCATDDLNEAEVAFAVAEDHRREGVATLLLERLAILGRRCGLQRLVAHTLPANADMLLVFRTVGLETRRRYDDGVVDVTLELSSLDELCTRAAERHDHALESHRALACG